ncbi:MAG: hypothetical protein HQM06_01590 [Magnetococcales bacterium]|nr:hypothetical protein [Magnetococcales bacterium]
MVAQSDAQVGKGILLVEGKNDKHVILALCQHFSIPETFTIKECIGDDRLFEMADALIPAPGYADAIIGLVVDADERGVSSRWQQLVSMLQTHGYDLSSLRPDPEGSVLAAPAGCPRLGLWIMPNNRDTGRLEDFLLAMVQQQGDGLEIASRCLSNAEEAGITTFKATHRSKAVLHTYLAWQDEPGMPMGQSITRQVLQPTTTTCHAFIHWLKRLFHT